MLGITAEHPCFGARAAVTQSTVWPSHTHPCGTSQARHPGCDSRGAGGGMHREGCRTSSADLAGKGSYSLLVSICRSSTDGGEAFLS